MSGNPQYKQAQQLVKDARNTVSPLQSQASSPLTSPKNIKLDKLPQTSQYVFSPHEIASPQHIFIPFKPMQPKSQDLASAVPQSRFKSVPPLNISFIEQSQEQLSPNTRSSNSAAMSSEPLIVSDLVSGSQEAVLVDRKSSRFRPSKPLMVANFEDNTVVAPSSSVSSEASPSAQLSDDKPKKLRPSKKQMEKEGERLFKHTNKPPVLRPDTDSIKLEDFDVTSLGQSGGNLVDLTLVQLGGSWRCSNCNVVSPDGTNQCEYCMKEILGRNPAQKIVPLAQRKYHSKRPQAPSIEKQMAREAFKKKMKK